MKNRKFIVVAFMLTACMIVGVGYAALTDTLNIGGDAEVSQAGAENTFDGDVYFLALLRDTVTTHILMLKTTIRSTLLLPVLAVSEILLPLLLLFTTIVTWMQL